MDLKLTPPINPGVRISPEIGDFVEVRGRRWLVEGSDQLGSGLGALRLACIDDDAQGEPLQVAWTAELDSCPESRVKRRLMAAYLGSYRLTGRTRQIIEASKSY